MRKFYLLPVLLLLSTANAFAIDLNNPVACILQHCDKGPCAVPGTGQGVDVIVLTPSGDSVFIETFFGNRSKEQEFYQDFQRMTFAKKGDLVELNRNSLIEYMPSFQLIKSSIVEGVQIPQDKLDSRHEKAVPLKVNFGKNSTAAEGIIQFDANSEKLSLFVKETHETGWTSISPTLSCFEINH